LIEAYELTKIDSGFLRNIAELLRKRMLEDKDILARKETCFSDRTIGSRREMLRKAPFDPREKLKELHRRTASWNLRRGV